MLREAFGKSTPSSFVKTDFGEKKRIVHTPCQGCGKWTEKARRGGGGKEVRKDEFQQSIQSLKKE